MQKVNPSPTPSHSIKPSVRPVTQSMATDMMVWNVSKDKITERMAVSPDEAWVVAGPNKAPAPDRSRKSEYTIFILDGKFDTSDVDGPWLNKFMEEHNLTEGDLKAGQ